MRVETAHFTVDDRRVDDVAVRVDTWAESAAEQVDSHDAEDKPEDEADQQNVEDGWNSLDQRVHHHLHRHQWIKVISMNKFNVNKLTDWLIDWLIAWLVGWLR